LLDRSLPHGVGPAIDAAQLLPGAEDADDGVTVDADVVRHERLAGGGFGEAFVGVVSPVVGEVPVG
jgi:hypothetical protein